MTTTSKDIAEKDGDLHDSIVFNMPTPDGNANIIVSEYSDGTIYRVDMLIGKAGSSVAAWCNALSRMTTFALRKHSLMEVIQELEDISTDRYSMVSGIPIRSGPEALSMALKHYKLLKRI